MVLNAFRIRLALMGAGLVTLVLYLAAGGRLGPSNRGTVVIEYGAYPEVFEGLEVAIDGEAAGALQSVGAATRTAFAVSEGRHEIRVISSRFASRGLTLDVEKGGTRMLLLDLGSSVGSSGESRAEICFQ